MDEKQIERLINKIRVKIVGKPVDVVIAALSFVLVNVAVNSGYDIENVVQYLRDTEENQKQYRSMQ
jgi:hypothetical protein